MQALWNEIRTRNLHRVAAGYAVVAWVLVQGASILLPAFAIPQWTLRLLIIFLVAAFPVLLVALWFNHSTIERYDEQPAKLHHTEWLLIGLLALVLAASAAEFFYFRPTHTNDSHISARRDAASIAVLAFDNMSSSKENEYFSDGISEQLLNDLAQVSGLRVAARTSSFSFKGKRVGIDEIGRALHVRTVVEGSVRREGNRVRITAQLIDVRNDYHIWSKTYDREISDIFAVQEEISRVITSELTGRLLPNKSGTSGSRPRLSPQAYTAYLKGRFFLNKRNRDAMADAVKWYRLAIALKPDYAEAHADLALTYALLAANAQQQDTLALAQAEAAVALRLAPDDLNTMIANATVQATSWNWSRALLAYQRLLAKYPDNADAHHFYGNFFLNMHLPEGWLREHQRAAALDPLSPLDQENIGEALHVLGRNDEAIAAYRSALALDPNLVFTLAQLCVALADKGAVDEARQILADRLMVIDGNGNYTTRCKLELARSEPAAADTLRTLAAMAASGHKEHGISASLVGLAYAYAGDTDRAVQWFSRAVAEHEPKFFQNTVGVLLPGSVTASPQWKALIGGPAFQEWARVRTMISKSALGTRS